MRLCIIILFTFLIVIFPIFLFLNNYKKNFVNNLPREPKDSNATAQDPGEVANIFGWGYNRSVCQLPDAKGTSVTFFFAQDLYIHYVYSDNFKNVYHLPTSVKQNPDYDVFCERNKVYVFYSDNETEKLFAIEGEIRNSHIIWNNEELIAQKDKFASFVAPSARIVNGIPYVSYMEFGQGSDDSKVYVVSKVDGKWTSPKNVYQYSNKLSQVLGNSISEFGGNPFLIISPVSSETRFSQLVNAKWSSPSAETNMFFYGQLEWQTIPSKDGIHMVYRGKDDYIYSFISVSGKIYSTPLDTGENNIGLFEDKNGLVYLLYNNGKIRQLDGKDGVSKEQRVFPESHKFLYWIRVPEKLYSNILPVVWLDGKYPKYKIVYEEVNLHKLSKFEKDSSKQINVESLKIQN